MSKRLGNAVDPFETLAKHGPDATRWYMITNASLGTTLSSTWRASKCSGSSSTLHNTYKQPSMQADGYQGGEVVAT